MINKDKMLKANLKLNNFLDVDIDTVDILRACKTEKNFKTVLKVLTKKELEEMLQDIEDTKRIKS